MLADRNLVQIPLNIHISGLVYSGDFEKGSQILTYPHFCRFTVVKFTARFEIILISENKQVSCIRVYDVTQK